MVAFGAASTLAGSRHERIPDEGYQSRKSPLLAGRVEGSNPAGVGSCMNTGTTTFDATNETTPESMDERLV